jgi:cobalt-precorrin-5B (C1)-methyltransferase
VKKEKLRSGYSTGACAAAAAKAAALLLLSVEARKHESEKARKRESTEAKDFRAEEVEIPFPDGSRIKFRIKGSGLRDTCTSAWASVVKDAGDDPDVTNGAEIVAEAKIQESGVRGQGSEKTRIIINGGKGVGTVTKPGLPVPVGETAINPVPRKMITEAVMEALKAESRFSSKGTRLNPCTLTTSPS